MGDAEAVTARIVVSGFGGGLVADGPPAALYVMVTADGRAAKVGALEQARNAEARLRAVEKRHRGHVPDPACYPMALAVVMELEGIDVSGPDGEEAWHRTTLLEGMLRYVLARRLGRLAEWADWMHVDRQPKDGWLAEVERAWDELRPLGASPTSTW